MNAPSSGTTSTTNDRYYTRVSSQPALIDRVERTVWGPEDGAGIEALGGEELHLAA